MRNLSWLILLLFAASASLLAARPAAQEPAQSPTPEAAPREPPTPQQAPPPQTASPSAVPSGPVIVLDPADGGTDTGARGGNGVAEKDVALGFARSVRAELERQGYRVVMTRNDDSNPSYDDRAATANAYREAIFISLHVSSTGTIGTARAYYYQFWTPIPPPPALTATAAGGKKPNPQARGFTVWEEAQRPYAETSHHLADLVQGDLAQFLSGSPTMAAGAAVRGLRSVATPAVAVEISSVSISDPNKLTGLAGPLGNSIARAIAAFRPPNSGGAK